MVNEHLKELWEFIRETHKVVAFVSSTNSKKVIKVHEGEDMPRISHGKYAYTSIAQLQKHTRILVKNMYVKVADLIYRQIYGAGMGVKGGGNLCSIYLSKLEFDAGVRWLLSGEAKYRRLFRASIWVVFSLY